MDVLLTILITLASILLIGAVLIQPGKGDMISGMSGLGGQFNSMLGSRRATDLLTKITIGLAAAIMVFSLLTNLFFVNFETEDVAKPSTEGRQVEMPAPGTIPPPPPTE